jgi:acetyl esterase/lipase
MLRRCIFLILICTACGVDVKADVYTPAGQGPFPIVVVVHGGGFVRGDKSDMDGRSREIAAAGYVVFNANYRVIAQNVTFPAFVQDIHSAVKWIKYHAAEYKGDPERVAITGQSAGAYIASIVAVTPHIAELQHSGGGLDGVSSSVQAAIPFYGHQDLFILDTVQRETARFIWGGKLTKKAAALASPVSYSDHYLPMLLFHNEGDPIVPVAQSRSMFQHLTDAGIPAYYYEFPVSGHDLAGKDEDWATGVAIMFLDIYLKGKTGLKMPEAIPERASAD